MAAHPQPSAAPAARSAVRSGGLAALIASLRQLGPQIMRPAPVAALLASGGPSRGELEPFAFWVPRHYTRNQIVRTSLFELMLVCWSPGSQTEIHDHGGQNCWLTVQAGRLVTQSYIPMPDGRAVARRGPPQRMPPGWTDYRSDEAHASIHQVRNPGSRRALSLHLYVRPIDVCHIYSASGEPPRRRQLAYHSVGGYRCSAPAWVAAD